MSNQDPHFQREAEKYENPIPSREYLLQLIADGRGLIGRDELAEQLGLEGDQYVALMRRLRAMERDGQLVYTRKGRYGIPEKMDLLTGTVLGHRDGFGFFRPDDGAGKDMFLTERTMQSVLHGDRVMAQGDRHDRRGRQEARIVRVLEPRNANIIGRYFTEDGIGFVVPDDRRISQDILIPAEHRLGARLGQVVNVELTQRPGRHTHAKGKVTEVLGDEMDPGMEIEIALRNHDLPHQFPQAVLDQVARIDDEVTEADKQGRVDLRQLPLVTIDGEDARDFDDAVYCEKKKSGGWRLWVAIADVSHYVRPGTSLNDEALKRGNSVYFPAQVIPMLPEKLSNGLCSLNPGVDRLCMVCEMTVSASGNLSGYKFYPAVMHSHARLTYTKVAAMLDGDKRLIERYQSVFPHLQQLHKLYAALDGARLKRGALVLETTETQFIFNSQRRIEQIVPRERNVAHKMIEECMILANVASARFVKKQKGEVLYRVHEGPGDAKLKSLRDFLGQQGLQLGGGDEPSPTDIAKLLASLSGRADAELVTTMVLRSMKQAVYSPDDEGHFGLALQGYSHFTSPIRRYPDLVLHRVIRGLLAKDSEGGMLKRAIGSLLNRDATKADDAGVLYNTQELVELGEHCSMTERRADDATRDVSDWLKCEFMQDHVGDTFDAVISGVTSFGLFVRLNQYHIDGLVHISSLENDYFHFDAVRQGLYGEHSGKRYRLGDAVEVKVMSVKLDDRQIDLGLVQEPGKGRKGKPKSGRKPADSNAPYKAKQGKPKSGRSGGGKRTGGSQAKPGAAKGSGGAKAGGKKTDTRSGADKSSSKRKNR
ncbi:RNAse R [Ferrimonas sediminum]|uniref:Ribonuclease R n=1 Tax=Ferrimonas sediminum TaxID=718193 RepID=A0A1G8MKL4_9GAMM|nr:ribonuclease R [Ferrimonas sediminum]SDI68519.1 RNAse R [Ferrimonas sediminum]